MVFVSFGREDFIFRTFAKIFWIRLALPHFSCIHFFNWNPSLPGEILDFLLKMSSKTWLYKCYVFGMSISLSFSTTFSAVHPRFLQEDLLFSKKKCIHEKCGRASRIQNILAKVLKIKSSLPESTKTTPKLCKLFTVWFPKELLHLRHWQNHWFLGELPSWREDFVKLWTSNDLGFLAEVRSW